MSEGELGFVHPAELIEPDLRRDLVSDLAEVLTPVLLFISKGRLTGTMDIRSWIVLRETRMDLIEAETIAAFAKRRGISGARVHELIKEFRSAVSGYRSSNRKSDATSARMSLARRSNEQVLKPALGSSHKTPTPTPTPGKESPAPVASSTGSANP